MVSDDDKARAARLKLDLGPIFDGLPFPAVAIDARGLIVGFNRAFGDLFGLPKLGHRLDGLDFAWSQALAPNIAEGSADLAIPARRAVITSRSGSPIETDVHRASVRAGETPLELVMALPVRPGPKTSASELSPGAIAHDLNNALSVILSAAKMASSAENVTDSREDIDTIIETVAHASRLTARLSALDPKRSGADETFDLNQLLAEFETVLRGAVGDRASLELDLWPEATPVVANRTQIEQLIMNLVVNARDAIPDAGGVIRVATLCGNDGESHLVVEDDGDGMHPWVRDRILDPYFTTKPSGQGTGLGLTTLRDLLSSNEVELDLRTAPGRGTRFDIGFKRPVEDDDRRIGTPASASPWEADDSSLYRRYSELTFENRVTTTDYWSGESSSVTPI